MVFPDDEVMIVLSGIAMGKVTDGEDRTMLHRVVAALEERAWIEIDEATAKIKLTESGVRAVDRWERKRFGIKTPKVFGIKRR